MTTVRVILTLMAAWLAGFVMVSSMAVGSGCPESGNATTAGATHGAFTVNATEVPQGGCGPTQSVTSDKYLEVLSQACAYGGAATCHAAAACPGGTLHDAQWVYTDGHTEPAIQQCISDAGPATPTVTGAMVAEAFARVPLPTSKLGMNPPDGETLVNLPTIFHTQADGFGRDVRLLGRNVHLEIRPVSYRWHVGQGGEFATDWAGKPYQRGLEPDEDPDAYVTWTYQDAGVTEKPSVTVVWGATYSVDGGPALTVPAQVPMASPAASLAIREARPVLTGS